MDYHTFREFADSWFLIAMFAFFVGAVVWALRPGSREFHRDAAESIFRHEDAPAEDSGESTEAHP